MQRRHIAQAQAEPEAPNLVTGQNRRNGTTCGVPPSIGQAT